MSKVKEFLTFFREQILDHERQNRWFQNKRTYRLIYVIVAVGLLGWQLLFFGTRGSIEPEHRRMNTSGIQHTYLKHFVYFYYYEGLFPVVARHDSSFTTDDYSAAGAQRILNEQGEQLGNEWKHCSRLGDSARILLYWPDVLARGTPENPRIMPFNILLFNLAIQLFWFVMWYYRRPVFGLLAVVFIGSSPFLLFEVYRAENIFALPVSLVLIFVSMHWPLFAGKYKRHYLLIPILTGILLGTAVNIRGEILPIIVSCVLIYWLNKNMRWFYSIVFSVLLVGTFYGFKTFWIDHFDNKWEEAIAVVEEKGGNPYTYPRIEGHKFWHPMFCGLGDYDTKYGYVWHDSVAYAYGLPILKEEYGIELEWAGGYGLDEYYDEQGWYYKKLDEVEEYEAVMKEKVTTDISNDPLWYAGIIGKRIAGFFGKTSPARIGIGPLSIPIPFSGWFLLPVLFLLWRTKGWTYLKLLLFTMPIAASSILIYGGGNSTHVSIYHLLVLAMLIAWLIEYVVYLRQRKNEAPSINT